MVTIGKLDKYQRTFFALPSEYQTEVMRKNNIQPKSIDWFFRQALAYYIQLENRNMKWIESYDKIIDWLRFNNGKGLLLYGRTGVGKTVIATKVIPTIFAEFHRRKLIAISLQDIKTDDKLEVQKQRLFCILDDVGVGNGGDFMSYGNKINAFDELVDNAEKQHNLLIITTNLNKQELLERYGERTIDRLLSLTKRVLIESDKSLR